MQLLANLGEELVKFVPLRSHSRAVVTFDRQWMRSFVSSSKMMNPFRVRIATDAIITL